jgi:UDP-glucose 4-epimerase
MTTYTITGGAGFIGSHLADALLAEGCRVVVLDDLSTGRPENLPSGVTLVRGDVADPVALRNAMEGSAGCFHLAAIASVQRGNEAWLECHRVNQSGSVAVLDTARNLGCMPVVYASSAAVYGDLKGEVAAEDRQPAPLTAYGLDKLGSELHAGVGWRVHGVPSFGCRFFNVYGARQDPSSPYSGVISIFGRLAGRAEPLTVHGDGLQVRDFIHVSDVVRHLLAAMGLLQRQPGAYVANVCTGRGTTILDLARLTQGLAGVRAAIRPGPARLGDIRHSLGDPSFATRLLGVSASVSLADGLAQTLPTLCRPG